MAAALQPHHPTKGKALVLSVVPLTTALWRSPKEGAGSEDSPGSPPQAPPPRNHHANQGQDVTAC